MIITHINGNEIKNNLDLYNAVNGTQDNSTANITYVYANNNPKTVTVQLENQYILISDLRQSLQFQISSANKRETGINDMDDFIDLLTQE